MSSAFVSWIRHDVLSKQKTYVYNLNLTLANEFMEKNENLWKKKWLCQIIQKVEHAIWEQTLCVF